ncbi:MAG: CYTH domain-containing protein [Patescibacteria group bacterium]
MKEIEMKFEVKSFTKVRERLFQIGAKLLWRGIESTQYFDYPDGSLRKKKLSLRIREWKGHSILVTCKHDLKHGKNAKRREEFQFETNDKKQVEATFLLLGLVPTLFYKKRREHWEVEKHVHVELDELEIKKKFVEIEGSQVKIKTLAKVLDIQDRPQSFLSYPEILRKK